MRRLTTALIAAGLVLPALGGPGTAQVQQGNPNAANQALSSEGQARATQQNMNSQNNTTMMNSERAPAAAPPPPGGGVTVTTPRVGR